jgi:hypothetical protein
MSAIVPIFIAHCLQTYHALHESNKAPECDSIILHDCVDRRKQIAHTLNVAKILVVFIIREEHILHLLQVDVGAHIGKRRVGIRVRNVLTSEDGDITICAMYVFLYTTDPIEWDKSASFHAIVQGARSHTYSVLLFSPPLLLLFTLVPFNHSLPPSALESDIFISPTVDVCATLFV